MGGGLLEVEPQVYWTCLPSAGCMFEVREEKHLIVGLFMSRSQPQSVTWCLAHLGAVSKLYHIELAGQG